ncbi:molybdopterin cofactor-binding domain-containing protein [Nonomuraea zeae]|uniref:molybdopterin cofactor-binding domain-containing protein n=1 Tax=Nonomuraea zeae TaxID=1642303 RepID=UPI001981A0A0|nr:molybdopterin cofactor-binding domain-containing protein [Nonomuraea zeae]
MYEIFGGVDERPHPIHLNVNGQAHDLSVDPRTSLFDCLREHLGLTGTKKGCDQGARFGVAMDKIRFLQGDSDVAKTRIPGASAATTTLASAIWNARDQLVHELLKLAQDTRLAGLRAGEVETRDEGLFTRDGRGATYRRILELAGRDHIEVTGKSAVPYQTLKRTTSTYGAHFAEVRVDEDTGEVRVTRWASAFDGRRIVSPKQAASQMRGGIIQGIGMALWKRPCSTDAPAASSTPAWPTSTSPPTPTCPTSTCASWTGPIPSRPSEPGASVSWASSGWRRPLPTRSTTPPARASEPSPSPRTSCSHKQMDTGHPLVHYPIK